MKKKYKISIFENLKKALLKDIVMNPLKFTLFILLWLTSIHGFCQYTDVINSNRPGVSRSAFSVGTNIAQFEIGPYMIKEKRTPATAYDVSGFGIDFTGRYGLFLEELEINIEGSYQNDTKTFSSNNTTESKRSNFKFLAAGLKYLVYDPSKNAEEDKPNLYSWKANRKFKWKSLIPAVSVYLGGNYDTEFNPYTAPGIEGFSPKVMIATQNNFPGGWVFVMNLIKDRIGTDQSDFQYILTLTRSLSPKWVIFGEIQGIQSDFYADNLFRFGGAYLLGKDFQLDTAITFNTKDTPSVFNIGLGASYRLDFHKDKIKDKDQDIDNGESAKDEGERQSNRAGRKRKLKDDLKTDDTLEKRKKREIDFDDN